MSTTYSEIYSTKLREQSKIIKGESNSLSKSKSQYVTLIKKFTKKERSSSMTKMKVKPRRINTKILKMSKLEEIFGVFSGDFGYFFHR